MTLIKLGQDPESPDGKSPTIYLDDEKDTYLVQGWKVADEARRSQLDLPGHEDVIEIPKRMVRFFPEVRNGVGTDS
ncbi:hypothetical protein [Streptomyces sp. NPDC088350]|uniref:hypothetical protein n=1 Tax=Streptomyces sp. NPDC088350 TaxID=3365854 RepID=UPI0037FAACE3